MKFIKKIRNFSLIILITGFALSLSSLFNGCDENTVNPPVSSVARTTITHASPNAPNVDILVGNNVIASNVSYPSTLPYTELNTGNNRIRIRATGTSNYLLDDTLFFEENKSYSVFAVDSVSKISALFLTDNLTVPGNTYSSVRFVNLSPNSPALDVAITGKSVVFPFYSFKQSSNFRPVNADTVTLEVRLAGTSTPIYTRDNVIFENGKIYTIFSRGFIGNTNIPLGVSIIKHN